MNVARTMLDSGNNIKLDFPELHPINMQEYFCFWMWKKEFREISKLGNKYWGEFHTKSVSLMKLN